MSGPYLLTVHRGDEELLRHGYITLRDAATAWEKLPDLVANEYDHGGSYTCKLLNSEGEPIGMLLDNTGRKVGFVWDGDEEIELVPGAQAEYEAGQREREEAREEEEILCLDNFSDAERRAIYGAHNCDVTRMSGKNWRQIAAHAVEEMIRLKPGKDEALSEQDMRHLTYWEMLQTAALRMDDAIRLADAAGNESFSKMLSEMMR